MMTGAETISTEKKCISFSCRHISPRYNCPSTKDQTSCDGNFDAEFNLGVDSGDELISAVKDLCESSYSHVKATLVPAKHDVTWNAYPNSGSFVHFTKCQTICDYTHSLAQYELEVSTATSDIPPELSFLAETDCDGTLESGQALAKALSRLRALGKRDDTRFSWLAALILMRKFVASYVESARQRIRRVLNFSQAEHELVFGCHLKQSELEEREKLLALHRRIRQDSIDSHR